MRKTILFLLSLAACTPPAPIATPAEVKIPIAIPCHIAQVPEPDWPIVKIRPSDPLPLKTQLLLADIETHLAYEDLLKAAISACL